MVAPVESAVARRRVFKVYELQRALQVHLGGVATIGAWCLQHRANQPLGQLQWTRFLSPSASCILPPSFAPQLFISTCLPCEEKHYTSTTHVQDTGEACRLLQCRRSSPTEQLAISCLVASSRSSAAAQLPISSLPCRSGLCSCYCSCLQWTLADGCQQQAPRGNAFKQRGAAVSSTREWEIWTADQLLSSPCLSMPTPLENTPAVVC